MVQPPAIGATWGARSRDLAAAAWCRRCLATSLQASLAIKQVLARQLEAAMFAQNVSMVETARRMGSSRSALDRLQDSDNDSVTLATLRKAAAAVGLQVRLELV
ncbi:MAG: XRE family transcriptional regulator [Acidobacteria bacterium]|nr:XRE family transcriptional regulator [Acidobacteriota bacterium]